MRRKQFLAAILLAVGFCFVSRVGYGWVIIPQQSRILAELIVEDLQEDEYENEPLWPFIRSMREEMREELGLLKLYNNLLTATISYMMSNPTTFTSVYIYYDSDGWSEEFFPKGVNTKGKIYVLIRDLRGYFSDRSGVALKEAFKIYLDVIYSFIENLATDMDNDIVALFISKGEISLGYFYEGEYHLRED